MAKKISNSLLRKIISFSLSDTSASFSDCAKFLSINTGTLSSWHRKFKNLDWPKDYAKTEDKIPLDPKLVDEFVSCFVYSGHISKILKRLVVGKCLRNAACFRKQNKILKRLLKKYPNLDFWLNMDFGEPREDILLFTGKWDKHLKKKYLDFSTVDAYTPFEYKFKAQPPSGRPRRPRSVWEYYDE